MLDSIPPATRPESGSECGRNFCWGPRDMATTVEGILNALGKTCPAAPSFPCNVRGAFAAHADAIRSNPLSKYHALLELSTDSTPVSKGTLEGCPYYASRIPDQATLRAHALERTWWMVLNADDPLSVNCSGYSLDVFIGDPKPHIIHPNMVCTRVQTSNGGLTN